MSLSRRIIAVYLLARGVLLWAGGPARFTSPAYKVAFNLADSISPDTVAPTTVWAIPFIVIAVLNLVHMPGHWSDVAYGLMPLMIAGWCVAIITATWPAHYTHGTWGLPLADMTLVALVMFNGGRTMLR